MQIGLWETGAAGMFLIAIAALVYICLPWYAQSVIWLVNVFIPDSVPFLGELLMFVPVAYKIRRIIRISEFLQKYGKVLAVLVGIGLIALIVCMIVL